VLSSAALPSVAEMPVSCLVPHHLQEVQWLQHYSDEW
jgi:hypothetical protein